MISLLDTSIIILYLIGIVALGVWAGLSRTSEDKARNYFLAGGSLTWPVIGLALFATNISTVHLVSLAEEGYTNGLAYGNFEWMAAFVLIILALFFAPFYIRTRVPTLPVFLERRYNRACRDWLAFISIVSAIFIHIGFSLYAGAVVLQGLFGVPILWSIIIVALLTGFYTMVGGLRAVVWTESIQTVILIIGAVALTGISYIKLGGWEGLTASVPAHDLKILRPHGDPSGLPWYSVLLGYPVIGIWYFCTDQTIVQRVLGAKDENHARVGPLFCGFIKILPVFIFVLPGLICLGLVNSGKLDPLPVAANAEAPAEVAPAAGAESAVYEAVMAAETPQDFPTILQAAQLDADSARAAIRGLEQKELIATQGGETYAHMIRHLLPPGLKGILTAALLAALMSTVAGALNSAATLFTYDLFKRWRPATTDDQAVLVGRVVTVVAMLAAMAWSPFLGRFATIFQGINTAIAYIAPPITVVFLAGVFWRGASARGAFLTMVVGSLLGLIVFVLDWTGALEAIAEGVPIPLTFMMNSFYLFLICLTLMIVLSKAMTDAADAERDKLVWRHPLAALEGAAWKGVGNYKILAAVLVVVMLLFYWLFS